MAVTCFPQVTAMLVELNPQLFLRGVDDYGRTIWKARNFPKIPRCSGCTTALRDAGRFAAVSKKTAYRMLNAGKIKAFRIGRSYRIPKVNVIRFLQNETPEDCNTVNATIDSVE